MNQKNLRNPNQRNQKKNEKKKMVNKPSMDTIAKDVWQRWRNDRHLFVQGDQKTTKIVLVDTEKYHVEIVCKNHLCDDEDCDVDCDEDDKAELIYFNVKKLPVKWIWGKADMKNLDDFIATTIGRIQLCLCCEDELSLSTLCEECSDTNLKGLFDFSKCDICTHKQVKSRLYSPSCCFREESIKRMCYQCVFKVHTCPFCKEEEGYRDFRRTMYAVKYK